MLAGNADVTGTKKVKLITTILKGLVAASSCLVVGFVSRTIFRAANRKRRRVLWSLHDARNWRQLDARMMLAWGINLAFFGTSLWFVVAFARCYSSSATNALLTDWAASLGISFLVTEPIQILVVLLLRGLIKGYGNGCMEWANNAGIDMSLFA